MKLGHEKTMACSGFTFESSNKYGSPAKIPSSIWNKESSHPDFTRAGNEDPLLESKISKKSRLFSLDLKRYFTITNNYIYYRKKKNGAIKGVLKLEDVQVELLPNKKGFIFHKEEFKSNITVSDEKVYDIWRKVISKKSTFFNSFELDYQMKSHLGAGSFADVFLVENKFTNEVFAGKVFSKKSEAFQLKAKKNIILSEISVLRRLCHNNIVKIEEVHETDDDIIILTELLRGGTLRRLIAKTFLPFEKRKHLINQLLNILEYLNSQEITHRDMKPENFMLRTDGSLVLIDFGLATDFSNMSRIERPAGTVGYIAPEILSRKDIAPEKIDIFSAGCIIFELVACRQLFQGNTSKEVMLMNTKNTIINLQYYLENSEDREYRLIIGFLNTDPSLRPTPSSAIHNFQKIDSLYQSLAMK